MRARTILRHSALCAALFIVAPSSARADVAPVEPPQQCGESAAREPCLGKKPGDACALTGGATGSCVALRCTNDAGETMLACNTSGSSPSGADDSGCATSGRGTAPALALFALIALAAGGALRRKNGAR